MLANSWLYFFKRCVVQWNGRQQWRPPQEITSWRIDVAPLLDSKCINPIVLFFFSLDEGVHVTSPWPSVYTLSVVQVTCENSVHIFIKAWNFGTRTFSEIEPRGGCFTKCIVLVNSQCQVRHEQNNSLFDAPPNQVTPKWSENILFFIVQHTTPKPKISQRQFSPVSCGPNHNRIMYFCISTRRDFGKCSGDGSLHLCAPAHFLFYYSWLL